MDLGKNILNILKRYQAVFVPKIGVFRKKTTPAEFDKGRQLFLPAIHYIELDTESSDGFQLVHYIQQQQNVSLSEAQSILDHEIAVVLQDLKDNGLVKLDGLGSLVAYGDAIIFKPLDLSGFTFLPVSAAQVPHIETIDNMDVQLSDILTELPEESAEADEPNVEEAIEQEVTSIEETGAEPVDEVPEEEATIVEETVEELPTEVVQVVEESNTVEEEVVPKGSSQRVNLYEKKNSEEEPEVTKKSRWPLILILIGLLLVAIAAVCYFNPELKNRILGTPMVDTVSTFPVDSAATQPLPDSLHTDSAITFTDRELDSMENIHKVDSAKLKTDSVKSVKEVPAHSAPPASVSKDRYQIVIGSHKTMLQAEQQAEELRKKGFKSVRAVQSKKKSNFKKVIYNTYPTLEAANKDREVVEKKLKGAWVDKIN